ncbi:MAG: hypothetical protein ACE5I1_12400 [bacterium]
MKKEFFKKFLIALASILILAAIHVMTIAYVKSEVISYGNQEIASFGSIRIGMVQAINTEKAQFIGSGEASADVLSTKIKMEHCYYLASALGLLFALLQLLRSKHFYQIILVSVCWGSTIISETEWLVQSSKLQYISVSFTERVGLPIFSFPDMFGALALLILWVFVFLRYSGLLARMKNRHEKTTGKQFNDPLFEHRRTLRFLLIYLYVLPMLFVFITYSFLMINIPQKEFVIGSMAGLLIVSALVLILSILFRNRIPRRPINILYLRSFNADKRSWNNVKTLREMLGKKMRLSGVVNPKELSHLRHFPFYLLYGFVFVLGDLSRVNIFGHNTYLEHDWKEGIKAIFSAVGAAIFDCTAVSENLVWEISYSLDNLAHKNLYFIIPNGMTAADLRKKIMSFDRENLFQNRELPQNVFNFSDLHLLAEALSKNN